MKYFKLQYSLITREIGKYIQCSASLDRGNISDLGKFREITTDVKIPEIVMDKKSKPTTLLSTWINFNRFLVVRNHFTMILKDYNIAHSNKWAIKIYHNDKILTDYELFHLSYPTKINNIIKYEQSDFVVLPKGGRFETTPTESVKLKNYEAYQNLKETLNQLEDNLTISYDKLVLDFNSIDEDLIRFIEAPFTNGYYVSEKLKKAIEEKGFTGMAFQEIEHMDKRIKVIY